MPQWYYSRDGGQAGPVDEEELESGVRAGELDASTLVWYDGMPDWRPLGEVRAALFAAGDLGAGGGEGRGETAACAVSGAVRPVSEMLEYGDHFVLPEHKEELVQRLHEGRALGATGGVPLEDPMGRARLAMVFMIITTVVEVLLIVVSFFGSDPMDAEAFNAADAIMGVIALAFFPVYILTIIFFCRWKILAMRNAHRLSTEAMEFTPGWAVGWYFVPIAMLWKPFQAMRELWNVTHGKAGRGKAPPALTTWWTLWILSGFVGQISFRAAMHGLRGVEIAADVAGIAIGVPLLLVTLKIVRDISGEQVSRMG